MRYLITLCFLIASLFLQGQDFIIKNSHDTIWGKIRVPAPAYHLHSHVTMTNENGETIDYDPRDLVGFRAGLSVYETQDIGNDDPELKFLKVIIKGKCSLYEYSVQQNHHALPEPQYLLKRDGEKFYQFDYRSLKKGIDDYFNDKPEIAEGIKNGIFRKSEVKTIVQRYNKDN